jgi:hypothetical protein
MTSVNPQHELSVNFPRGALGNVNVQEYTHEIQIDYHYGISDRLISKELVNGGGISHSNSMIVLSTGAQPNSYARAISKQTLRCRSGQGTTAIFGGKFTPGITGNKQIIGLGDDSEGFFFGFINGIFGISIRSNNIDRVVSQLNWNYDKMDGIGPSGKILDLTRGNSYKISFQCIGYGIVRFYIEDKEYRNFILVHNEFPGDIPSISRPSFPMCIENKNTTNATNVIMFSPSFAAMIEGNQTFIGSTYGIDNTKTISSEINSTNILTLRSKSSVNTVPNYIPSIMQMLSIGNSGSKMCVINVLIDATISGVLTWISISPSGSIEVNTNGDTLSNGVPITNGSTILTFILNVGESRVIDLKSLNIILTRSQTITISGRLLSRGSSDLTASLTWLEDN